MRPEIEISRIYCDTNTLPNNINPAEPKSQKELAALRQLDKRSLFGSHIVGSEAEKTKNATQRDHLIIDYKALNRVPKDEKLLGFNTHGDRYGGFFSAPIISDVQDEALCKELINRGLERRDAEHIVQAVCNDCDVFLTRDEKTIIKPHGQWLSQRFPKLKFLLPSELLEIIKRQTPI